MEVLFCALLCLCVLPLSCRADEGQTCYGPGDVAGIIIAAIVVTLVFVGLALAGLWYRRKTILAYFGEGCLSGGVDPPDKKKKKKTPQVGDDKFAFDNPYFRDEDHPEVQSTQDAAEKGHANGTSEISGGAPQQNGKASDATTGAKTKKTKISNPFSSVFNLQTKKQQRTMDDSCLAVEPERLVVPLRGHDFTGLGFNICGNMRDGIFVKDVLHRGPASESGKIKAGDRILSVTVSFSKMVYEDALTILSYASPYDVHLELEKALEPANSRLHQGPPASLLLAGLQGKRLGSSSFSTGQRLFHPLYRSQSIDDLTQIGKDGVHSPKRSQSIGLSALQRSQKSSDGSEDSRPVSSVLVTGSLNERMLANAIVEEGLSKKALESLREQKGEENGASKTPPDAPKVKSSVPWSITKEISLKDDKEKESEPPATESLPRKTGKRRAPAPPKPENSMETEAQVHHADDSFPARRGSSDSDEIEKDFDGGHEIDQDSLDGGKPKQNGRHDSDVSNDSLEDDDNTDENSQKRDKKDKKRRKSSSLGDLTNIEEAINKHSNLVLERAVSLDLQQQSPMPEGNLGNLLPSDAVECLSDGTSSPKILITSTPVPDRERTALASDLSRVGIKPSQNEISSISTPSNTPSECSLSSDSDTAKTEKKLIAADESLRKPLRFDADSDNEESSNRNGMPPQGEVIEISQSELDGVMMSHRQFLLKQAKATGVYSGLNPTKPGPGLSFESWSYEDSNSSPPSKNRAPVNGNSNYDSSGYTTALDSAHTPAPSKIPRPPEVSQVTLRMPNGNATRTIIISASDDSSHNTFGTSDSPPTRLEPPK